ncbi:hypothetical protein C8Q74DRAFT_1235390 [Fomes fomentarius]|nr:hypothetical protein C8Q74DRAFT_1235390 [Fomes fomentarius]
MSSSPHWLVGLVLTLYTLIMPVGIDINGQPFNIDLPVFFTILATLAPGYICITLTLALSGFLSTLVTLATVYTLTRDIALKVVCVSHAAIRFIMATPSFTLTVLLFAYHATLRRIRRVRRAVRAFALTFVTVFARQMLLAFLRPIGLAVQSAVVWCTTLLVCALTAVIPAAVWVFTKAAVYVWSQRDAPVRLFWASWASVLEMVQESYQVAKIEACLAYCQEFEDAANPVEDDLTDYESDTTSVSDNNKRSSSDTSLDCSTSLTDTTLNDVEDDSMWFVESDDEEGDIAGAPSSTPNPKHPDTMTNTTFGPVTAWLRKLGATEGR